MMATSVLTISSLNATEEPSVSVLENSIEIRGGKLCAISQDGRWFAIASPTTWVVFRCEPISRKCQRWFSLPKTTLSLCSMQVPKSDDLMFVTQYQSTNLSTKLRVFNANSQDVAETCARDLTDAAVEVIGMGRVRLTNEPQIVVRDDPNVLVLNTRCETTQTLQLELRAPDHICVVHDQVGLLLQIFNHGNRLQPDRLLSLSSDGYDRFHYFGITHEPVEASAFCFSKSYSVAVTRYVTNESLYTNGLWLWKDGNLIDVQREQSTGKRLVYLDLSESSVSLLFAAEHGCIVRQYAIDPVIGLRKSIDGKTKIEVTKVAKNNDEFLVCSDSKILFVSSLRALLESETPLSELEK